MCQRAFLGSSARARSTRLRNAPTIAERRKTRRQIVAISNSAPSRSGRRAPVSPTARVNKGLYRPGPFVESASYRLRKPVFFQSRTPSSGEPQTHAGGFERALKINQGMGTAWWNALMLRAEPDTLFPMKRRQARALCLTASVGLYRAGRDRVATGSCPGCVTTEAAYLLSPRPARRGILPQGRTPSCYTWNLAGESRVGCHAYKRDPTLWSALGIRFHSN